MNENTITILKPQDNTSNASDLFRFLSGSFLWDGGRQKNLAKAEAILAEAQAKGQAEIIKAQADLEKVKAENRKAMLANLGKIGFLIVLAVIAIIILKK